MTDNEDINNSENKLNNSDKANNILSDMNQEEIKELVCEGIDNLMKSGYLENLLKSESFNRLLKSEIFQDFLKSEIFQNFLKSDELKKLVESNKDSKYGFSQPEEKNENIDTIIENNINTENMAINLLPSIAGIAIALFATFLLGYNKNDY